MKLLGAVLVVIGILSLVYGGIGYNRQKTILDVGGIKATATESKTLPIAPIAGVIALVGGVVLMVAPGMRRT